MSVIVPLFQNANANGSSQSVIYDGYAQHADIYVYGSFNGATVQVQNNIADANDNDFLPVWMDTPNGLITSAKSVRIELTRRTKIRVTISGAGATTSLNAVMHYQ
jgi:hypothetical protein